MELAGRHTAGGRARGFGYPSMQHKADILRACHLPVHILMHTLQKLREEAHPSAEEEMTSREPVGTYPAQKIFLKHTQKARDGN